MPALPLSVSHYTVTCAAGRGNEAVWDALLAERSGLAPNDFPGVALATHIGRVRGLEEEPLPAEYSTWDCRNNRLAWMAFRQDGFPAAVDRVVQRYGARRVALVVGTSTASIGSTEDAYRDRTSDGELPAAYREPILHSPASLLEFMRQVSGIDGPSFSVSTACSSSARVFGSAERLIAMGLADAVLVGGADTLCRSVLQGFHSLELVSGEPCRPFDIARRGLSLGEGAAFALLEASGAGSLRFAGYGEASDAHHMSTPHPEGLGARLAMERALASAGLGAADIDYVKLHGTATRMNDAVEGEVLRALFREPVAASSVKGWIGHTLGAAGSVEAVMALLCLARGLIPGTLHCRVPEPRFSEFIRTHNTRVSLNAIMSNAFGFGGNNCSLVFTRSP